MLKLTDLPLQAVAKVQQLAERGSAEVHYARKMFEAGALKLEPPQNIAAFVADIRRWGEFGMIPALNASIFSGLASGSLSMLQVHTIRRMAASVTPAPAPARA